MGENGGSMAQANPHFEDLKSPYIFPIIDQKVAELQKDHPNQRLLNLGVGDVGLPLAPVIAAAIKEAVDEMTQEKRGYGPCEGYPFLRKAIHEAEYKMWGIEEEEIFISSGTNPDAFAIQELLSPDATVAVADPTYPVYRDATILRGRKLLYIPALESAGFRVRPPKERADLVYICTPANPTGVALTRDDLTEWVEWAQKNQALLVIDNVYNAFASSEDIPPSIYAIEGAREGAIELRSFSKTAGFTGLRCSYNVVPKTLHIPNLHSYWTKWVNISTNGINYPIQKGALASLTPEGKEATTRQVATYMESAKILREALQSQGQTVYGGFDAPYLFWKAPDSMSSWEFFDHLLEHHRLLTIPGSGFGRQGEGFVRLSAFISTQLAHETKNALHHHLTTA